MRLYINKHGGDYHSPQWWTNFMDTFQYKDGTWMCRLEDKRDRVLKKYNGMYGINEAETEHWVDFKTEKDMTMFLLRWS